MNRCSFAVVPEDDSGAAVRFARGRCLQAKPFCPASSFRGVAVASCEPLPTVCRKTAGAVSSQDGFNPAANAGFVQTSIKQSRLNEIMTFRTKGNTLDRPREQMQ